ncbi:hypothetical protein GIB67_034131 [Kingdonia uniflora]|uniref:ABC transmembrane type-1 domain-containing protein n=1 Tax=Kingdonia uniflora TaxID=39325 RepID=A0A7J7L6P3_9MAGN|nr:hypothetical protein GIB67_034131 [Kingdonia uniflora]
MGTPGGDLEHGDAFQATNVGFSRVYSLAKPDALNLVLATIALLIASTTSIMIPTFGGRIIDIVSGDISTPEKKDEALNAVKSTILEIILIVVIGSICAVLRAWLFSSASKRVVARLRKNLFGHLIQQEIAFFDVTRTGELLTVSIAVRKFGRYLQELSHKTQAAAAVAASIAEESFGAIRTVDLSHRGLCDFTLFREGGRDLEAWTQAS